MIYYDDVGDFDILIFVEVSHGYELSIRQFEMCLSSYFRIDNFLITGVCYLYRCAIAGLVRRTHGLRMTHGEANLLFWCCSWVAHDDEASTCDYNVRPVSHLM